MKMRDMYQISIIWNRNNSYRSLLTKPLAMRYPSFCFTVNYFKIHILALV